MCNNTELKKKLKHEIFDLMDEVKSSLKIDSNIDNFIDQTNLFDHWENLLPDREFPIFILTILNNIRKDTIIDTLVDTIIDRMKNRKPKNTKKQKVNHLTGIL